jgi:hypothetical protein
MVVVGGCAPESSLGVVVIISVGGRYREKRRMGVTCRCGSLCSWCRAHLPPYISPPSLRQDSTKQRAETKADTHTQKTGERSWTHTHRKKRKKGGSRAWHWRRRSPFSLPPPSTRSWDIPEVLRRLRNVPRHITPKRLCCSLLSASFFFLSRVDDARKRCYCMYINDWHTTGATPVHPAPKLHAPLSPRTHFPC